MGSEGYFTNVEVAIEGNRPVDLYIRMSWTFYQPCVYYEMLIGMYLRSKSVWRIKLGQKFTENNKRMPTECSVCYSAVYSVWIWILICSWYCICLRTVRFQIRYQVSPTQHMSITTRVIWTLPKSYRELRIAGIFPSNFDVQ